MAAHAVPRHVLVTPSLPRHATGKVDKEALRAELLARLNAGGRPSAERPAR